MGVDFRNLKKKKERLNKKSSNKSTIICDCGSTKKISKHYGKMMCEKCYQKEKKRRVNERKHEDHNNKSLENIEKIVKESIDRMFVPYNEKIKEIENNFKIVIDKNKNNSIDVKEMIQAINDIKNNNEIIPIDALGIMIGILHRSFLDIRQRYPWYPPNSKERKQKRNKRSDNKQLLLDELWGVLEYLRKPNNGTLKNMIEITKNNPDAQSKKNN